MRTISAPASAHRFTCEQVVTHVKQELKARRRIEGRPCCDHRNDVYIPCHSPMTCAALVIMSAERTERAYQRHKSSVPDRRCRRCPACPSSSSSAARSCDRCPPELARSGRHEGQFQPSKHRTWGIVGSRSLLLLLRQSSASQIIPCVIVINSEGQQGASRPAMSRLGRAHVDGAGRSSPRLIYALAVFGQHELTGCADLRSDERSSALQRGSREVSTGPAGEGGGDIATAASCRR